MGIPTKSFFAVGALLASLLPGAPASSAEPKPAILYQNLNNPRGITFGPDGALYVAEAGLGDGLTGNGPCVDTGHSTMCLGPTGSIGRFAGGVYKRLVDGLPSLGQPGGHSAIGPSDVAFVGKTGIATVGLGMAPSLRGTLPAYANKLGKLIAFGPGNTTLDIADLAAYEQKANPDGGERDSNPQSVAVGPRGILVTDAGGNSLIGVSPQAAALSTVRSFPARSGVQSVPTGVAVHNGEYYVGELTGFPFPIGKARVLRINPDQPKTYTWVSGLTNVIDVAFSDVDDTLYILEIAHNSLLDPHPRGALLRQRPGSPIETVVTGINMPGGLAVKGGYAYVTDCAVCVQSGRILRYKL